MGSSVVSSLNKVTLVGGPDVDARLELMHCLEDTYNLSAIGSHTDLYDKFNAHGFTYHHYYLNRRVNPISDLITIIQLYKLFRKTKPQIVHTFDSKLNVWGRLAAKIAGVPITIGTITGLGSTLGNESLTSKIISGVYKKLQTLACKYSDLTIFQNHDDARLYLETGIVPEEKTKIILGSGVTTKEYSPDRITDNEKREIRQELGIEADHLLMTMISRLIRSKGINHYASAAKHIASTHPKVRFLLVGPEDNENRDALNSEELSTLKRSVIWPGTHSNIPAILAASDIFVLPSAYAEGIPRVLLEAASMGLPLITTNSPGCKEVVDDGVNGYLIPVADTDSLVEAILQLVEQPELRKQFGIISRQLAKKNFDLEIISNITHQTYQQLLTDQSENYAVVT